MEQIAGAQQALEAQLEILRHAATVGGDTASLAMAQNQLSRLGGLHQRVEQMQGGGLAAIRAEVMATVAVSQTMSQQARISTVSAQAAEAALHAASEQAHRNVTTFIHDFYERKIFDPYLRFASPEEEEAYRKRETERELAIKTALAEGTPQGNLRASDLAIAQLEDAGAHGADASPQYQSSMARLRDGRAALAREMGVEPQTVGPAPTPPADPLADIEASVAIPGDVLAALRATGVVVADQSQTGHGVNATTVAPGIFLA